MSKGDTGIKTKRFKKGHQVVIQDRSLGDKVRFAGCDHKGHTQATVNFRGFIETITLDPQGKCIACLATELINSTRVCSKCKGPKIQHLGVPHDCAANNARRGVVNGHESEETVTDEDRTPSDGLPEDAINEDSANHEESQHSYVEPIRNETTLTSSEIRRAGRRL